MTKKKNEKQPISNAAIGENVREKIALIRTEKKKLLSKENNAWTKTLFLADPSHITKSQKAADLPKPALQQAGEPLAFTFYFTFKNEDAPPFFNDSVLAVADGLGSDGASVHRIDRKKHPEIHAELVQSAFGDCTDLSPRLKRYLETLLAPLLDDKPDTSALWASRIVLGRCVYALTEGDLKCAAISDESTRKALSAFITKGLDNVAKDFDLHVDPYLNQKLLPTTLSLIRYEEKEDTIMAEAVWAGDSRCYALMPDGLKLLSVDDEDAAGTLTNIFRAGNEKTVLHYARHEFKKPCVLMTASDGTFDPFSPNDHFGLEYSLLTCIRKCGSASDLAKELTAWFGAIHADDASMAFVPFGVMDYTDLKQTFAERSEKILPLFERFMSAKNVVDTMYLSEDDVVSYVRGRSNDRYDQLIKLLTELYRSGANDIALSPELLALFTPTGINATRDAVIDIVTNALAKNYDTTSAIDAIFNPAKLRRFRLFFRLKATPDEEALTIVKKLSDLGKEYTTLIKE